MTRSRCSSFSSSPSSAPTSATPSRNGSCTTSGRSALCRSFQGTHRILTGYSDDTTILTGYSPGAHRVLTVMGAERLLVAARRAGGCDFHHGNPKQS
jgi:hypothetical protein